MLHALHGPPERSRRRLAGALPLLRFAAQRWFLRADRLANVLMRGGPRVIATACWSFPIYSQTFVYQELRQLLRKGYALRFVYSHLDRQQPLDGQFAGLWRSRRRLELDPAVCRRSEAWFVRRAPDRVEALVQQLASAAGMTPDEVRAHRHVRQGFAFARLAAAYRPAYLHSYFFYEGTLFAFMASSLLGIPRGLSCYADHVLQDYELKVVNLHLKQAGLVIATSQRIRAELVAIEPTAGQVLVKPNGIDTAYFPARERRDPPAGRPFRLVSVSRIEPKKGLIYLVDAVRRLRDRGLEVVLHLVGEADASDAGRRTDAEIRERVAALKLEDLVRFEGRRTQAEVDGFLAQAHVFVAPFVETSTGDKDGVPTSLLEAMASALPVVATNAGSIGEVIAHGIDGMLVPQRDAAALADAIASLCLDAEGRATMGARAAATVRARFDAASCEAIFHDRLARLLSGAADAPVPRQLDPDPA